MDSGVLKLRERTVKEHVSGWTFKDKEVQDAWYEIPVDENWTASFRLATQAGRPVVGELRIFPTNERNEPGVDYNPGEWDAEYLGSEAPVPVGGLKATKVRKAPFRALDSIAEIVGWVRSSNDPHGNEHLSAHGFIDDEGSRRKRGPKGPSNEELVSYALEYLDLAAQGVRNPHTVLSDQHNHSTDHSVHLITTARERSLLSSPVGLDGKGGRAGGHLLERGEAVRDAIQKARRTRK